MNDHKTSPTANSPLINYALTGLDRCWLANFGRWSQIYHLDGRDCPNESLPPSDVFYTLNVLLGLSRIHKSPSGMDLGAIFQRNVVRLIDLPVPQYAFGMALWAAAELNLDVPGDVLLRVRSILSEKSNWCRFRAQDLGMMLAGVVAQARCDPKSWFRSSNALFAFLVERYRCESHLFSDSAYGVRRRFGSFATQTYLTLACYVYGEFAKDDRAIDIANSAARKLIALQGPHGEWPWFFYVPRGTVVDFYEVYSVHQYGMAPAFLEYAERHGVAAARGALIRGFRWVTGENQLRRPMLVPALHLSIRSQVRKGELRTKAWRIARATSSALLRRPTDLIDPIGIQLRLECRSYELGWILWSFGQRSDLPELTHHEIFASATSS